MVQILMMDLTMGMYANISFINLYFFLFNRTTIEDLKLIQKLRQRRNGVSAGELALGKQTNSLFSSRKIDVCNYVFYLILQKQFFSFSQMIHINLNLVVLLK